ncbi:hypothetical protein Hdeb2414_s0003g00095851 [Helianthus debilis subsp. tardiflorus]
MTHYFCSKMIGIKKLNRNGKQVFFYDENLSSKIWIRVTNVLHF